nr:MAG TPA: hypothetical protein [Caudoviricetes sp.]
MPEQFLGAPAIERYLYVVRNPKNAKSQGEYYL